MNRFVTNYNTFSNPEGNNANEPASNQKALDNAKRKENYRVSKHQIPPDFDQCAKHRIATRAAKPIFEKDGKKVDLDPATGLPVENEQFSHCCRVMELSELAPAYPMYFEFVKASIYLLTFLCLVSGIYNFVTNWQDTTCQNPATLTDAQLDDNNVCVLNFATRGSLANTITDTSDYTEKFQDWLNLGGFFALIIFLQWFRYTQRKTAVACDQMEWTAADFTLFVRGIPKLENVNIEKELEEYFINHGLPDGKKLNVKRVLLTFDVREINANKAQIQKKIKEIKALRQKQVDGENKENSAQPLISEMLKLRNEIKELEEQNLNISDACFHGTGQGFTGCAFVTVNTQKEANEVADYWGDPDWIQRLYKRFPKKEKFHGADLRLRAAPEPSDVYWENLHYSRSNRFVRIAIVIAFTILVLVGIWCAIFFLTIYKDNKVTQWDNTNANTAKIMALSYFVSFAIQGFNYALIYIIQYTTGLEKHTTWTSRKMSTATKLAWCQFLITSVVMLIISIQIQNYWGQGGLIVSVFQVFEINMITPAAVLLMAPFYWMNWFMMKLISRKGDKSNLTQAEANIAYEMPEFELSAKYALILRNMYSAAFYAPVLPIALPLTIFGNFLIYWADKHVLVRKSSLTKALGANLAFQMTENMEWVLVVYGVSNVVFNKIFFDDVTIPAYICIVLSVVNALLPMAEINEAITPAVKEQETDDTFDNKKWEFEEDYDRSNPATRAYAVAKFECESRGEVFNKEDLKNKMLKTASNKGSFLQASLNTAGINLGIN